MEVGKTQKVVNKINTAISGHNAMFDEQEKRLDNVEGAVKDLQKENEGLKKEVEALKKGQPITKGSANARIIKDVLHDLRRTSINQAAAELLKDAKRPCGRPRFKSLRGLKQAATIARIAYVPSITF